jgi:hypothetical protein
MRSRILVALVVAGSVSASACSPDGSDSGLEFSTDDPGAVESEVQRVFDDAACWCESYMLRPFAPPATVPANLATSLVYPSDASAVGDTRLVAYANPRTQFGEITNRFTCDALSVDAARGSLSDHTAVAADFTANACTGWASGTVSHGLCQADFDACLGHELDLAASSSTRPLPRAVRTDVRAESTRRLQASSARAMAELARLRSGGCPIGATDPDCTRLASGYDRALYLRVSDATSTALTSAHASLLIARSHGDLLSPGLVEGTGYGAAMFGSGSDRVATLQQLYGPTSVASVAPTLPPSSPPVSTSGGVQFISRGTVPTRLGPGLSEATLIRVYVEQENLRLSSSLRLSGAGAPVLPAGTAVNVYLVHFDPTLSTPPRQVGTVSFLDRRVLGILSTDDELIRSNATLGRASTTYFTSAGVGIEPTGADVVTLGSRTVQLDLTVAAATTIDELRIVTLASVDPPDTAIVAERAGDLPYAARLYGDVRTARAVSLLARHHITLPHSSCLSATTGEVTSAQWSASPRDAAPRMLADLELAVGRELVGPSYVPGSASIVEETAGLRLSDMVDAIDYLRDASSVLDGVVLAPQSGCGASTLRVSAVRQRSIIPLQAAFSRGGSGALGGETGTSWYAASAAQLRDVGTVGAAHILRVQLSGGLPSDPTLLAAANDTLALLEAEIGPSWSEWRICEGAGCDGDATSTARWSLFERGTSMRTAGVPVLVASDADARCLLAGHEPLAPSGATCAHVTSSPARYLPMTAITTGLSTGAGCPMGFGAGAYCRRSFSVPSMRAASPTDRRLVLWCARAATDPAGVCRSYELVDAIYTGAGPQVHAFGGDIGAEVAQSFMVDPSDPAIAMFNSLGFQHDFVPPLENELIENGDGREDSWRAYLTSAERSQTEATRLLEAARQHELEQLAYDRTVEAELASAALAQQQTVSQLCGADVPEADCAMPRMDVRLGQTGPITGLSLFDESEPSPTIRAGSSHFYTCDEVPTALGSTSGTNQLQILSLAVQCARWQTHRSLASLVLHDVPEPVVDAVIATSVTGVVHGDFAEYGGTTRQELIQLYQQFEELRAFSRTLDSTVVGITLEISQLRNRYSATENGWFEGGFGCFLKQAVTVVSIVAAAAVAIVATEGAGLPIVIGALAGAGSSLGAESDSCADADLDRKNLVLSATASLVHGIESMATLTDHARTVLGQVASADGHFDDMAREVELARRRREIAERLATSGIGGDPTWRALQVVERRRADQALFLAQQQSFVARRAIEVRLAVDMPSMTSTEQYVDPPSFWANDVFDLGNAIEYVPQGPSVVAVDVRAEAVADYVHELGSFVDGYSFLHRFSEGDDLQIVNLGEAVEIDPSTLPPGASAATAPFVGRVVFQCNGASTLLPGGVPNGFVVTDPRVAPEPCGTFDVGGTEVDLGGVHHAVFSFAIPSELDNGYFGERLAGGNFNYRIQRVALNLVGRALFDCEHAARPTECYGDGNIQYSMRHDGETVLTNWDGDERAFAFEPGVIQRARGIADERWLTNPLSGTDASLIAPYERLEWWGRPLAGTYTIEIEDRPEMDWRNLENVQVLIHYHYWTRQR